MWVEFIAKKCSLLKRKIKYAEYVVSEAGVEADPETATKISKLPTLKSPNEVRQFLSFAGYYM